MTDAESELVERLRHRAEAMGGAVHDWELNKKLFLEAATALSAARNDALEELMGRMRAKSDNAYCDMIGQSRRDECLGWEAKIRLGKFGEPELNAHRKCQELYGRHVAFHEAAQMLEEAIDAARKAGG